MNKSRIGLLCVFVLICLLSLAGCDPYFGSFSRGGNKDTDFDLYQMAVYTLPGGEQSSYNCLIRTTEEDEQGRVLFSCSIEAGQPISAFLICQKREKNQLLYYKDVCVIVSASFEDFSSEDLLAFKLRNDWGEKFDNQKCGSLPVKPKNEKAWNRGNDLEDYDTEYGVENRKTLSSYEKEIFPECGTNDWNSFYTYGGSDKDGKRLYYIQAVQTYNEGKMTERWRNAAVILPKDEELDLKYVALLDDFYDCGSQIQELKERANWKM